MKTRVELAQCSLIMPLVQRRALHRDPTRAEQDAEHYGDPWRTQIYRVDNVLCQGNRLIGQQVSVHENALVA